MSDRAELIPPTPASERRVRLLDPHTINQIAAGEVVERPASVVKELVENALDSGAQRIEVELRDSGRSLIRVSDDGCGMRPEDAVSALQRHATSKIQSVDDLGAIGTLGFRGEALPSIASVSRMTLRTCPEPGARFVLRAQDGRVESFSGEPGRRGTEVRVEDLFYNTPARLKFLKSDATEMGAILEVLNRYALAYPWVAFRVVHQGAVSFESTGSGDQLQAVAEVWGREVARCLAEVDAQAAGLRVTGFVSPPHFTRPTRAYQYLSVNGRPIRSRTLTAALDQSYRDLTPERRYPAIVLNLEVAPDRIDVNVSPTKSEVKFMSEGQAFDAIRTAIRTALDLHGMMPSAESIVGIGRLNEAASATHPGAAAFFGSFETQRPLEGLSHLPKLPREEPPATLEGPAFATQGSERFPFAELLDGLRVIGQAMNTFILAETRRGIVVVDQHVAHERILYEYLCGLKGHTPIERQPLLEPQTLHLDRRAATLLMERLDEVERVGFDLEPFGGESFLLRSAPAALRGKDPLRVLRDVVDELVEGSVARRLTPTREQIWITSACKMAVKAGDPLSHAEMEKLIVDLASTENPYLCPHGRPITLTLGTEDLLRKFKRT